MNRIFTIALGLGLVGCSTPATSTQAAGGLTASELAQHHGVGSYVIDKGDVTVRGLDGATLAVLRVTEPSAVERLVQIEYATGVLYEDEITRPVSRAVRRPDQR